MRRCSCMLMIAVFTLLLPLAAFAGDIDTPRPPMSGSGMPTLQDIYEYLTTGATWTDPGSFQEPSAGPAPIMKTLKEIYDDIRALFEQCLARPDQVLNTVTFFNIDPTNWGPRTGNIPTQTVDDTTVSQAAGYYDIFDLSLIDPDLAAVNIRNGVTIFGVPGSAEVATGTANAADVLVGKTFSNTTAVGIEGTMPNRGSVTITPATTNQPIEEGYHTGSGYVEGDPNLVAGNIRQGISIFGVSGDPSVVDTSAGTATENDILLNKMAYVGGQAVTGTITPGDNVIGLEGELSVLIPDGMYMGGKTATAQDSALISSNIKAGATIFGVSGDSNVVDTGDGTATADDILLNQTAYVGGQEVTGTVPPGADVIGPEGALQVVIPNGLYIGGKIATTQDSALISSNIKAEATIFGVNGDPNVVDTGDGTATENDILANRVAYVGGQEVRGNIPIQNAAPWTVNQAAGYYYEFDLSNVDTDLDPANIAENVTIFGVTGTYTGESAPAYLAPVPKTEQTRCYDSSGTEISCSGTGQDGDLQKGVASPDPRFTDNSDGTLTDNLTGLIWVNDNTFYNTCGGTRSWNSALTFVNSLQDGNCGLSDGSVAGDWRLPNIRELFSLLDFSDPLYINWQRPCTWTEGVFWSSTTDPREPSHALGIQIACGYDSPITSQTKETWVRWYVCPVRGGQ